MSTSTLSKVQGDPSNKKESGSSEPPSKVPKLDHSSSKKPHFKNDGNANKNPQFQDRKEKWRQKDAMFHYGNYDRYYGKRAVSAGHIKDSDNGDAKSSEFDDHRLKFFSREWFEGKKVLDIGCNVGYMTMAIAHRFSPSSIVGLDIDGNLIRAAITILKKKFGQSQSKSGGQANANDISESSEKKAEGESSAEGVKMDKLSDSEKAATLKRVRFESGNYVLSSDALLDCVRPEYDVVLALSLTKWIHLNWGDDGMKRFFRRVYRHLHPGGIFLLEPQPWSTYKKRRGLTPEIAHNYDNIHFKPDRFRPFLLSQEIGFESCEVINKVESEGKGFSRPIYLFWKPKIDRIHTSDGASLPTKAAIIDGGETSKNGSGDNGNAPAGEPSDDGKGDGADN